MSRPRLVIFAKAPLMGRAKTRLAADIGPVHAQRLYRAMTAKVLRETRSPKWETVLAVTPSAWIGKVPEWRGALQIPQVSGSLSPRLSAIFSRKGPTLVIGTDSPQVTQSDIAAGFEALRHNNGVFGPADDGGFWLMGLNAPAAPHIFDGIRWSSENALADVTANMALARKGGRVAFLRALTDVDDAKALRAVRSQMKGRVRI